MTDDIALDFDTLRYHASGVEHVAQEVTSAVSAISGGHLAEGAFGLMCAFMVPPTMAATGSATKLLGQVEGLLGRGTEQLRGTAGQWQRLEEDLVDTLRSFDRAIS